MRGVDKNWQMGNGGSSSRCCRTSCAVFLGSMISGSWTAFSGAFALACLGPRYRSGMVHRQPATTGSSAGAKPGFGTVRLPHFFNRIKYFRGIATRYDKCPENYLAAVNSSTPASGAKR